MEPLSILHCWVVLLWIGIEYYWVTFIQSLRRSIGFSLFFLLLWKITLIKCFDVKTILISCVKFPWGFNSPRKAHLASMWKQLFQQRGPRKQTKPCESWSTYPPLTCGWLWREIPWPLLSLCRTPTVEIPALSWEGRHLRSRSHFLLTASRHLCCSRK